MMTSQRLRIIDCIRRYGLSLYTWHGGHAAYRLHRRMELAGMLRSFALFAGTRYYRLATQGSLGPQQLRMFYPIGEWCHLKHYVRPHPWELASAFPWLPEGVACATGEDGLAIFKVDMGGEPDDLVRKALGTHRRLAQHEGYLAARPTVWILTATEPKANEINHYIARSEHRRHLRVSIVPDYESLLTEGRHASHRQPPHGQPV